MVVLKNAREINEMREACRLSNAALWAAEPYVKPGVTTKEIDNEIRKFIEKAGAKPSFLGFQGFPASSCISINNQIIHGIPARNVHLKEGDIVSIDVGAFYNGFHGDNAYTFPVGVISDEAKKICDVTAECLNRGIMAAKPGNRIGDIGFAVQEYAESFGFGVVKDFVGHGVGKEMHEDPEVPNYGKPGRGLRLVPGMTIAIEPMINISGEGIKTLSNGWTVETLSGSLSAHFEHTVVITDEGAKILTLK